MTTSDRPAASRRDLLRGGLGVAGGLLVPTDVTAAGRASPRPVAGIEGQRRGDLGDGRYLNPVLSGDRADPNILKDGRDYYVAFSSFVYYPGAIIWHSTDLVNWRPIGPALTKMLGSVFALDIAKHNDRYFVYIPVLVPPVPGTPPSKRSPFKTYVVSATSMHGPWSEPHDMDIDGFIDPGHVVGEDGKRYLFLSDGHRVRISDDGLSRDGEIEKVYNGWRYPADWIVEGFALEGPKLLRHDGWFYMFSGQGGTAGPPTSHMVVVARSRSVDGPWENCPHNPIVRTASRDEPWWSRGHATPVQGPAGDWWMAYHGYENGFRTLGRQMLLEPFVWTADGWPRATGEVLAGPLRAPRNGVAGPHGIALSGPFTPEMFGTRMSFYAPRPDYLSRATMRDGAMDLAAVGSGPATSSPLAMIAGDRSYSVSVALTPHGGAEGGLLLFYNERLFCGVGLRDGRMHTYIRGTEQRSSSAMAISGDTLHLKLVNDEDVASFYYSIDGIDWKMAVSFEVSGYNHNVGNGFLSLRPALFASGAGSVTFRTLAYAATRIGARP